MGVGEFRIKYPTEKDSRKGERSDIYDMNKLGASSTKVKNPMS